MMSTTHEIKAFIINAHFTLRCSSMSRVVLQRIRPPRPLPHAKMPWPEAKGRCNQCPRRGGAGMRVWDVSGCRPR
jgi:hypothetical protein